MDPEDVDRALERGLLILGAAAQTSRNLQTKLRRAGFSSTAAAGAAERLASLGYIDDRRLAAATVRHRHDSGRGSRLIAAELRHKGVPDDLAAAALADLDLDADLRAATALVRRLVARHDDLGPEAQRRVLGTLYRRGFPADISRTAWRAALAGQE